MRPQVGGVERAQRLLRLGAPRHALPFFGSRGDEAAGLPSPARAAQARLDMSLDIYANVDRLQTRVAIMQGGKLLELKYEGDEDVVGNIYLCKVTDVVPGLDACFVDCGIERNAFLHVSDAMPEEPPRGAKHSGNLPRIQDVVKPKDTFLVQVTKGPLETKGARATRHISLPGRYLVLTTQGDKVGVSKKIENDAERKRLRDMAAKLRPEGFGLIVRTRAEDARQEDFEHDIRFLTKVWRSIETKARQTKAPALIHADVSLVFEVVRDILTDEADSFWIDDKVVYDQVLNLLDTTAPQLRGKVKLYREPEPIFTHFGVDAEIDRALQSKIMLPHGGHLNLEGTTALTTIDVNTGKFTGASSLEKTVLLTNLDACAEIARQLRLRDIGGIIVIDFIDMDKPQHRKQVMAALRDAFAADRMRTRIMHITKLGLVEMTRKRTGVSLTERLLTACPCCGGSGKIHSAETVAMRARNEIRQLVLQHPGRAVHVVMDPQCTLAFIGQHGSEVEALEKELGVPVYARATREIHPEAYEVELGDPGEYQRVFLPFEGEQVVEVEPWQVVRGSHGGLLALVEGTILEVPELPSTLEKAVQIRLTKIEDSYLRGSPLGRKHAEAETATAPEGERKRRSRGGRKPKAEVGHEVPELVEVPKLEPEVEYEFEAAPAANLPAQEKPVETPSPLQRLFNLRPLRASDLRRSIARKAAPEPQPEVTPAPEPEAETGVTAADEPEGVHEAGAGTVAPKKRRRRGGRGRSRRPKASTGDEPSAEAPAPDSPGPSRED